MKKRVLSGIRASGRLHIGNYLGAVKGMLALQSSDEYETFYMVADLHALTTPYDVNDLQKNRREVVRDYLAAGLDPKKSVIFEQSDSLHGELSFYLSSVVTIARMQHLPTYKEKVKQFPEHATMALLNYPVLMAADILAYKANAVPVGDDQLPHLEVAREIARKINEKYGMDFPEPEQFKTTGHYIPSLTGKGKMSKSVEGSFISMSDTLDEIRAKVAQIPTDSGNGVLDPNVELTKDHPLFNIITFVKLFEGDEKAQQYKELYNTSGIKFKDLKDELSEAIFSELKPIQQKRATISDSDLDQVIEEGGQKARSVVQKTISELRLKMGLK